MTIFLRFENSLAYLLSILSSIRTISIENERKKHLENSESLLRGRHFINFDRELHVVTKNDAFLVPPKVFKRYAQKTYSDWFMVPLTMVEVWEQNST